MGWARLASRLLEQSRQKAAQQVESDRAAKTKKPKGRHAFRAIARRAKQEAAEEAHNQEVPQPPQRSILVARAANPKVVGLVAGDVQTGEDNFRRMQLVCKEMGSQLQQDIVHAASQGVPFDTPVDEALTSCVQRARKVTTTVAEADALDKDRSTLVRLQSDAACCLVLGSGYLMGTVLDRILEGLAQGHYNLLMVIKKRRYDETPCRLNIKHGDGTREKGSVVKLLQSELSVAFLLQNTSTRQVAFARCWLPTPLKVLERNTSSLIVAAQRELEGLIPKLTEFADASRLRLALINTDSYSANFAAEAALCEEDTGCWTRSHYACDVHRAHTICSKQYKLLDGHVSAMIYSALSVQHAGGTARLRQALTQVLEDKLVVVCAAPPSDDSSVKQRLQMLLDLFLGELRVIEPGLMTKRRRRRLLQRIVIAWFLNGDTRDENHVEHFNPTLDLPPGAVLAAMKQFLVPTLLPGRPCVFSRKSWCGAQEAVEEWGLLASLHNLLEPMIMLFTKTNMDLPAVPTRTTAGWGNVADGYRAASSEGMNASRDEASGDFPDGDAIQRPKQQAHAPDDADADAAAGNAQTSHTGDANWQEYNRQLRLRMISWARSKPGNVLIILRSAMEGPLMLLADLLRKSGIEWERAQQLNAAQTSKRTYVVLEACAGTALQAFHRCLDDQFHAPLTALSNSGKTRVHQVLMFRLLAVVGSCATHYLSLSWQAYPVKLFKVCFGKTDVTNEPGCVLCSMSKSILDTFPTPADLLGPEAQSTLIGLASMLTLDIARIESVHSANRRVITAKSVQTTKPNLERISAEFALRSNHLHKENLLDRDEPASKSRARERKSKTISDKPRQVPTWGWAWRAFLNEKCTTKFSASAFTSLSAEYASLSERDRQYYEERGQAGMWN